MHVLKKSCCIKNLLSDIEKGNNMLHATSVGCVYGRQKHDSTNDHDKGVKQQLIIIYVLIDKVLTVETKYFLPGHILRYNCIQYQGYDTR